MSNQSSIIIKRHDTPVGTLTIGSYENQLCLCDWDEGWHHQETINRLLRILKCSIEEGSTPTIEQAIHELDEYFAGKRQQFSIPLLPVGTDFQRQVWNALLEIPFGQTISYGEEARRIGRPQSCRAVANANGRNALAIFIPCHRVIGSNGSLTGYGGGMANKRLLLELERPR